MADTKISALTALAGVDLAPADLLPVVDASAALTKSITMQGFLTGILGSTGFNGATVTTNNPLLNQTQTWNAGGVTFTGWKLIITDTASAAASLLMDLQVGGGSKFNVGKAGDVTLDSAVFLAWSTDVKLFRDAANILAQRNGVNAQAFRLYNTFTDGANYERFGMRWTANELFIGTEKAGTGASRTMLLQSSSNIVFQINGANDVWSFSTSGHFIAGVDNTYDFGAAGATRARTGYFGTSVVAPTFQTPDTTVAALPAAGAGNKGQRRHVTDAAAPTFLATVVGGGAVVTPVFSNGTNWVCG